jgi:very-short-patch-repair endonuclease
VIELDGEQHRQQAEYDLMRDTDLHKKWVAVVRYRNSEVIWNPDKVYKEIMDLIETRVREIKKNSI